MTYELKDWMASINQSKINIIQEDLESEKEYPSYIINRCLSGFVDCDGYIEYINFPFFFNVSNYTGIVKAGTPLVQAIPIKRDGYIKKSRVRQFTKEDHIKLQKQRYKRNSHESIYRDFIWTRK